MDQNKMREYLGDIVRASREIGIAMGAVQRLDFGRGEEINYTGDSVIAEVEVDDQVYSIHVSRIR